MNKLQNILKIDFVKNVLTLFSGTVFSQGVYFVSSIFLARLYTPKQFGLFGLFFSISVILSSFSTLKYEHAIIVEADDKKAKTLVLMCLLMAFCINGLMFVLAFVFDDFIFATFFDEFTKAQMFVVYLLPVSSFLITAQFIFQYYCNRHKRYKKMVANKMIDVSFLSSVQMGLGGLKFKKTGLVLGFLSAKIMSLIHFVAITKNDFKSQKLSQQTIKDNLKTHRKMPFYALPAGTIGTFSTHLPVLLIGRVFGGYILGLYSFMERVLSAPVSLVSRAVLDVFKQKASQQYNETGNCRDIFLKTSMTLLVLAIIPTLIMALYAPELFAWLFGDKWLDAGNYTQILSVLFFFRFIVNPMTYMFYIAKQQKYDAIWQVAVFFVTAFSIWQGYLEKDIYTMLYWFSGLYSLLYVIAYVMCYRFSCGHKKIKLFNKK